MKYLILLPGIFFLFSCGTKNQGAKNEKVSGKEYPVKLITLDPGHFHAALVQKFMYDEVSPDVHLYAPRGTDYLQHLERIKAYNTRSDNPASWNEIVYTGPDFLEKMITEKAGNVVVIAGNNRLKAEYITRSINAGLNVLADKPMIINPGDFKALRTAFDSAASKGVLLFDIMTERYEVTTMLQKMLSQNPDIFGTLKDGTPEEPAVTKVSVHHFSKLVSGKPLQRPQWYFDVCQQGEGIVDVTTHLVDLVQWECFSDQLLDTSDIAIVNARRWATDLTLNEFSKVTGATQFPEFLNENIKDGKLEVFSNGEILYLIKGKYAKVSVEWKFEAPEGGGDTHYSIMHGTKCDLIIKQGAEEHYRPELYIENIKGKETDNFTDKLKEVLKSLPLDSLDVEKTSSGSLKIIIPHKYRVSHEEHFSQVMHRFLGYLKDGKIPEWEINAMITKYYTTTSALRFAKHILN